MRGEFPAAAGDHGRRARRPDLAVTGASAGEITLWRRGSNAAAPQALTLDRDGSQLFAGGKFVGRWFEGEGEALFLPDWLNFDQLAALGLRSLVNRLLAQVDRKVSIMIYDAPASIEERGPNLPIPR